LILVITPPCAFLIASSISSLHPRQIEARGFLHWGKLDGRLPELGHLLLHEHEAPELVTVEGAHLIGGIGGP
jgi:hypothetical protein